MNTRRVAVSVILGLVCGIFCAYGAWVTRGTLPMEVTSGVLAATVYNRVLLGFVVGISDQLNLHPAARGAVIGALVSICLSIVTMVDGSLAAGLTVIGLGILYGVLIDYVATRLTDVAI